MSMMHRVDVASDRVMVVLVSGLELEFGRGNGAALAKRFLDAEEVDFHWDARVRKRWIGSYRTSGDEDMELDRVQIVGRLDGRWFVEVMIVDGDGDAHGMIGKRSLRGRKEAITAFTDA